MDPTPFPARPTLPVPTLSQCDGLTMGQACRTLPGRQHRVCSTAPELGVSRGGS